MVKRETDVGVSLGTNQWTLSLRLGSGHKPNFYWIFFLSFFMCVCVFSFAFVFGSLMLFGKPTVWPVPRGSI